jgi:CubicO group peptidase (beta-lactamase class C family)
MTVGLSRSRLGRLHDVMAGHIDGGALPGLVLAVARRGGVHVEALGTLEIDRPPKVERDSIFRISSMTKPMAAAAAMILVEECVLRLDDPVDDLLPELADRRVLHALDAPLDDTGPAHRPITLRDLLTFRMGFGQVFADPGTHPIMRAAIDAGIGMGPPDPEGPPEPDEWMRRLGALPLMYQPGQRWLYHTGADVLGVLLARASGRSLEEFLRERLFEPLGMRDTGFSVPSDHIGRLTTAYWTAGDAGELTLGDPGAGGKWSRPPRFPSAGAGLVSTVDDMLAFGRMMLALGRGPGGRILSRPAVRLMTSDQLTVEQKAVSGLVPGQFDGRGWGFGMGVRTRSDDLGGSAGSYGWDGGLGSSWYNDPAEDLVGILLTNASWASPAPPPAFRDFWTCVYQAIED